MEIDADEDVKPFNPRELIAVNRAVVRRTSGASVAVCYALPIAVTGAGRAAPTCRDCPSPPRAPSRSPPRSRSGAFPAAVLDSATAGALSMFFSVGLSAPHVGVYLLAILNALSHLAYYALAIAAGVFVTTVAVIPPKPPLREQRPAVRSAIAAK
ncbi:MAG: hypothetical protein WBG92_04460 [Thiohalocapsa sp.]